MTKQLSNCCKASIDLNKELDRPECYTCSLCDGVIGSPLKTDTDEQCIEVAVTYFRDALIAIGRHSIKANEKHSPGQPVHWNRTQSQDQWGSWGRHLSALGTIDEETGSPHHIPWAWRTLAIVQLYLEANKKKV